jgi:hypothetical protein
LKGLSVLHLASGAADESPAEDCKLGILLAVSSKTCDALVSSCSTSSCKPLNLNSQFGGRVRNIQSPSAFCMKSMFPDPEPRELTNSNLGKEFIGVIDPYLECAFEFQTIP